MARLNDEEKKVLLALSELEPATLEELAARSGLEHAHVKSVLDGLAKKGLLDELDERDEPGSSSAQA